MNHKYKLIVSNSILYKEFEILPEDTDLRLGTEPGCEFRLDRDAVFESIVLELKKEKNWELTCMNTNVFISIGDPRKLYTTTLLHGDQISVCYASSGDLALSIRFLIDFETEIPNFNWKIDIGSASQITIGDDASCDIVIQSPYSHNNLLTLTRNGASLLLSPVRSEYGVNLNGKPMERAHVLYDTDFFSVADFFFYYKDRSLYFDKKGIRSRMAIQPAEPESSFVYPCFVRNTRSRMKMNTEPISVLDPSAIPQKPKINYVTTLLPPVMMFLLVVVLRGILNTSGGTFVIFSICSMGLGVITSILNIYYSKKEYRESLIKRAEIYNEYIGRKNQEITRARAEELTCLEHTYFSISRDLTNIENFTPLLFDRSREDDDFLDIYLGVGRCPAMREIEHKEQEQLEIGDDFTKVPEQLQEAYRYIENAPVVLKMKEANAVGIVGSDQDLYRMFRNILIDLSARHYYRDVRIFALLGDDTRHYDWIRLLPHLNNDNGSRNIVCDNESKNNVFEGLYREMGFRAEHPKADFPWNVILVMDGRGLKSHPISRFIGNASELKTVFVFFEKREEFLPQHCSQILHLNGTSGTVSESADTLNVRNFTMEEISDERAAKAVMKLAPVYCEEISLESQLRKSITLFELLGIYAADDLDLKQRWSTSRIEDSMAVPMGVNVKDEIVYLDLHEKYHGPHGLVAGTTGSGKSEILQTFILGAATLFRPSEIGFLIIDFKGGGMVNQFRNLPHLLGAITNIDGKEIDRSLKSIRAELLKRQNLFAKVDVNHIDKYIHAYKEGRAPEPLPHLVIIVDEFAELKAEQPDFMQELISTARIGRSLGVHLILATQKPAGQVNDQIWSNSKFKLCLKVQTQEDSNEVLKSPLAAEIKEPGRAYLQVGNNEIFELFQSGFSGAPEKTDDSKLKAIRLNIVRFNGARKLIYEQKPAKTKSSRNQLEALVDYIHNYCESSNILKLKEICLPPLAKVITFDASRHSIEKDEYLTCPIGIYDNPDNQIQDVASLTPGSENIMIIGSAQFGKTNLLEQMIRALADRYTPSELNMYIIDFGSMVLKNFEKMNHIGGVVTPTEDEKLRNLFKYLTSQISIRREKLLAAGVSSFASYLEAGHTDMPHIVVFIDNLTVLKEMYLQDNDVLMTLTREGIASGITFVVANSQTSGIGYRYLANFSSKIALYCNESGEYATLMGISKIRPDEIPGRCILELDKNIYECQTFLAFEGEKEFERVQNMQIFVKQVNARTRGQHAVLIPEIPEALTESYIFDRFSYLLQERNFVLGLNYDSVMPYTAEIQRLGMLGITGGESSGKSNYLRYLLNSLREMKTGFRAVIFDDFRKKFRSYAEKYEDTEYCLSFEKFKETITETEKELAQRYEHLVNDEAYDSTWLLLVINSQDGADQISQSRDCMKSLKNIVTRYHVVNSMVIVSNIPDAPIPYGAPELYKMVKEGKNFIVFDDMESLRVVDLPLSVTRNFKKKISLGDAYFISGTDCVKIKTPLSPVISSEN